MISISIVSHGQFGLIQPLLDDLDRCCSHNIEVLLTINIPEILPNDFSKYHFPVKLIINTRPKGFGANHNAAFKQTNYPYFCVLNPDIRLMNNPFDVLIEKLKDKSIGVIAPMIIDRHNNIQDSAREFLTFSLLFKRIFFKSKFGKPGCAYPDWIAGMFMLFRKEVYAEIGGFDEAYFLYCEDMDLCARLNQKKYKIYYNTKIEVIHLAQRQSHKNPRYLIWHIKSLLRYFCSRR